MTRTISSTYSTLVTLSGTSDNPTTITTAGLLNAGLYADSLGAAWMITNAGSILDARVTLVSAGTVVNAGSIAESSTTLSGRGILLEADGSVTKREPGVDYRFLRDSRRWRRDRGECRRDCRRPWRGHHSLEHEISQRCLFRSKAQGRPVNEDPLRHVAPLGREHIGLTGDYGWSTAELPAPGSLRPLRQWQWLLTA